MDNATFLKALHVLSPKYADNVLFKFFMEKKHRQIHKWLHYFPIYDKWFKDFRGTDLVFVEIGVNQGGSLQMWKDYFGKDAKIIGIDIDERCKQLEEDQITVEIGSQEDVEFWNNFKKKYPRVDILLDDGGHTMKQQIVTFTQMFPHVKDGGIYICEDCHTSYWKSYGGGLKNPNSYIEFTKTLIDQINAFYTGGAVSPNYFTTNIGGIHFYDSIVVVEKSLVPLVPLDLTKGKPSF